MTMRRIAFGEEARKGLLEGISLATRCAAPTLGPITRTVMVDRGGQIPDLPGNGYEVTRFLEDPNPLRNLGFKLAREAAHQTLVDAGDGATTTLVLTEALLRAGLRLVTAGMPVQALKVGMERAAQVAEEAVSQQARPVSAKDSVVLEQIATLACGDVHLGRKIAEAFEQLGAETVVSIETIDGHPLELNIREGFWFDRGLASSSFSTGSGPGHVMLNKAHLVLHEGPIEDVSSILRILEGFARSGKAIAFVADSFGEQALATLVRNQNNDFLKVAAILAPGNGPHRAAILEDMAVATGAQVIGSHLGTTLGSFRPSMLGHAERLEVDMNSTRIIDAAGDQEAIEIRRRTLRKEIMDQKHLSYDRELLQQRLARLSNGIARLRLGGAIESESRRLKEAAEQSIAATHAALRDGVVPGGGSALANARHAVSELSFLNKDEAAGASIVANALDAPLRTMLANAGVEPAPILASWNETDGRSISGSTHGIDIRTGKPTNPNSEDIIEPLAVVRSALRNAVSTTGVLLLTEAGVVNQRSTPSSG
ncbi:MAG: chaperonin GroEL [Pseudomonadota bacterium]